MKNLMETLQSIQELDPFIQIIQFYVIPMHIVKLINVAVLLALTITKNVKMSRVPVHSVQECFIFMMAII